VAAALTLAGTAWVAEPEGEDEVVVGNVGTRDDVVGVLMAGVVAEELGVVEVMVEEVLELGVDVEVVLVFCVVEVELEVEVVEVEVVAALAEVVEVVRAALVVVAARAALVVDV